MADKIVSWGGFDSKGTSGMGVTGSLSLIGNLNFQPGTTGASRYISMSASPTTASGNSIVIQAGDATAAGTGGSVSIQPGGGAGGPGAGTVTIGNTTWWNGATINGTLTVTNQGPNTGTALTVNAGGQVAMRWDWDNINLVTSVVSTAGRILRFTGASQYQVRGSGTTSSTTSFLVQNANASASFTVKDDRSATFAKEIYVDGDLGDGTGSIYLKNSAGDYSNRIGTYGYNTFISTRGTANGIQLQFGIGSGRALNFSGGDPGNISITSAGASFGLNGVNDIIHGSDLLKIESRNYNGGEGVVIVRGRSTSLTDPIVTFKYEAAEKVRINNSGNMGIGTSTPTASLHISGSSNSVLFEIDSPTQNNILHVSGSGRVGIGKATDYALEIANTSSLLISATNGTFPAYSTASAAINITPHIYAPLGNRSYYSMYVGNPGVTFSGSFGNYDYRSIYTAGKIDAVGGINAGDSRFYATSNAVSFEGYNPYDGNTGTGYGGITFTGRQRIAAGDESGIGAQHDNGPRLFIYHKYNSTATKIIFSIAGSIRSTYFGNGNLSIGNGETDMSARLGVKGSGTTSSTTSFLVQNANATASLQITDNQSIIINGSSSMTIPNSGSALTVKRAGSYGNIGSQPLLNIIDDTNHSNVSKTAVYISATGASDNRAMEIYGGVGIGTFAYATMLRVSYPTYLNNTASIFVGSNFGLSSKSSISSYAANNGGGISFWGDDRGQASAPVAFAGIRGVKENSTYLNSLGNLAFYVQTGSAGGLSESTYREVARFNSSGSLGIGTSSPAALLHISGASSNVLLEIDSPTANNIIYVSGSGNVGINTSSPTTPLFVKGRGNSSSTTAFLVENSTSGSSFSVRDDGVVRILGSNTDAQITLTPSGGTSQINLNSQSVTGTLQTATAGTYAGLGLLTSTQGQNTNIGTSLSGAGGGIRYWASLNGSQHSHIFYYNLAEQMRLSYTGNLIVGISGSDTSRLSVRGSGATSATTSLLVQNANASASLQVRDDGTTTIASNTNRGYNLDVNGTGIINDCYFGDSLGPRLRTSGGSGIISCVYNSLTLSSGNGVGVSNNIFSVGPGSNTNGQLTVTTPAKVANTSETVNISAGNMYYGGGEGRFVIQAQGNAGGYNALGNMYIAGGRNTNGGAHGNVYLGVDLTSPLGNVTVGTTSSLNYKFNVSGSGNFTDNLTVTGSATISNILTLSPQDPLPSGVPTGSFAVSSSAPPKPYFYDGTAWNALY